MLFEVAHVFDCTGYSDSHLRVLCFGTPVNQKNENITTTSCKHTNTHTQRLKQYINISTNWKYSVLQYGKIILVNILMYNIILQ